MTDDQYSTTALTTTRDNPNSGRGYQRAAEYLLQLPDAATRRAVVSEATIAGNVAGGIYSDNIYTQVRRWLTGDRTFPYTDANHAMLARERADRNRTGIFTPEPIGTAFAALPHA